MLKTSLKTGDGEIENKPGEPDSTSVSKPEPAPIIDIPTSKSEDTQIPSGTKDPPKSPKQLPKTESHSQDSVADTTPDTKSLKSEPETDDSDPGKR